MKKIQLKGKLLLFFLLIGLVPLLFISLLSQHNAREEMENQIFRALDLYANLTRTEIEGFFLEVESFGRFLSTSSTIFQSLNTLSEVRWDTSHFRWLEETFLLSDLGRSIMDLYHFDIFFLTDHQGRIVFSTLRELVDVDLSHRDYIERSLQGEMNWSTLFYSDIVDENSLLLSVPIYSQGSFGELVGTLNLMMGQGIIDGQLHGGIEDLGETANAYLIDGDGLLMSNTLLGEYTESAALNQRIETEAVSILSHPIKRGELDFHVSLMYIDYMGESVLGSLEVLTLGETPVGLVVEVTEREAFQGVYSHRNLIFILLLVLLFFIILGSFLLAGRLTNPMRELSSVAEKLSSGDLRVDVKMKRDDELGQLASSFNQMIETLKGIVSMVSQSAEKTSNTSQELASGTQEASASIEEVASTMNQFSSSAQDLNENSTSMAHEAQRVQELALGGLEHMEMTEDRMKEIIDSSQEVQSAIDHLNQSSEKMVNITSAILSIADQTDLLALNAAVEAARAGEHGQGFAVVANEVKKLAEETQSSIQEIQEIIHLLQENTLKASSMMEENNQKIEEGASTLQMTGESFHNIVKKIDEVTEMVNQVRAAGKDLSQRSEDISAATEEQTASMEELTSISQELAEMAEYMTTTIGKLVIE